jgi:hypothetical protein
VLLEGAQDDVGHLDSADLAHRLRTTITPLISRPCL